MKIQRGFTLPEVMVAAGLVALLLTILVRAVGPAYRIGHEEIARGGLEAGALMVSKKIEADLLNSAAAGVSLMPGGSLVVQPIETVSAAGRVVFVPKFFYWRLGELSPGGEKRLMRSEIETSPSGTFDGNPLRWKAAQAGLLPSGMGTRCSVALAGVTAFSVNNPPGVASGQVGGTLTFKIEMTLPIATTRKVIRLERAIEFRTSGV